MSPSDKSEETTNCDSKEERESHSHETVKSNGMDQTSSPASSEISSTSNMARNIPSCTAKISTLKCSENDQMKTFDPGEASNNENISIQSGHQLKFPVKSSNCVTKSNKNYKAGSKINKLADMLAKRSQNIVEMTKNVTSDIITDIMCTQKVESNINATDISDLDKTEDKSGSHVLCKKTVNIQQIESVNKSQNKFVPNENSENLKKLQPEFREKSCDRGEILSQETAVSDFNALKESLVKSETDGSTKTKDKFSKHLKCIELSLILPENSSCSKLVHSEISKESTDDFCEVNLSNTNTSEDSEKGKCSADIKVPKSLSKDKISKKQSKIKSRKHKKAKCLVETSTQTLTVDFVPVELSKPESKSKSGNTWKGELINKTVSSDGGTLGVEHTSETVKVVKHYEGGSEYVTDPVSYIVNESVLLDEKSAYVRISGKSLSSAVSHSLQRKELKTTEMCEKTVELTVTQHSGNIAKSSDICKNSAELMPKPISHVSRSVGQLTNIGKESVTDEMSVETSVSSAKKDFERISEYEAPFKQLTADSESAVTQIILPTIEFSDKKICDVKTKVMTAENSGKSFDFITPQNIEKTEEPLAKEISDAEPESIRYSSKNTPKIETGQMPEKLLDAVNSHPFGNARESLNIETSECLLQEALKTTSFHENKQTSPPQCDITDIYSPGETNEIIGKQSLNVISESVSTRNHRKKSEPVLKKLYKKSKTLKPASFSETNKKTLAKPWSEETKSEPKKTCKESSYLTTEMLPEPLSSKICALLLEPLATQCDEKTSKLVNKCHGKSTGLEVNKISEESKPVCNELSEKCTKLVDKDISRKNSESAFTQFPEKILESVGTECISLECDTTQLCEVNKNSAGKMNSPRTTNTSFIQPDTSQVIEKSIKSELKAALDVSKPSSPEKIVRPVNSPILEKCTRSGMKKNFSSTTQTSERVDECLDSHDSVISKSLVAPIIYKGFETTKEVAEKSKKSASKELSPKVKKSLTEKFSDNTRKTFNKQFHGRISESLTAEIPREAVHKNVQRRMSEPGIQYSENVNESAVTHVSQVFLKNESFTKDINETQSNLLCKASGEKKRNLKNRKSSSNSSESAYIQFPEKMAESTAKLIIELPPEHLPIGIYEKSVESVTAHDSEKAVDKQHCKKNKGSETNSFSEITPCSTTMQLPDNLSQAVAHSESTGETVCEEKSDVRNEYEINVSDKYVHACMYCTEAFVTRSECTNHEKSHSPKKSKQITKCQFCKSKFPSPFDLKRHCIKNHPLKYAYCAKCDERFCEKSHLYSHNKMLHLTKAMEEAQIFVKIKETLGINPREKSKEEIEELKRTFDKKTIKVALGKQDLKVDVSFDSGRKSSTSPRIVQKVSPKENKTEEQLLEMEMLFYSHLSGNIKENLTNHLDGKIDKNGKAIQTDVVNDSSENSQTKSKSSNLLSVVTANTGGVPDQITRAPSPYQTRSKTPNPLPPTAKKFKKLPNWQQRFWEKYNFPTNYRYEHRFWDKNYLDTEKSVVYLKDLSCLDIKTQLTMRENIKKLDNIKRNEENNKTSDRLTFPEYLSLIPKVNEGKIQEEVVDFSTVESFNGKEQTNKEDKNPVKAIPVDMAKSRRKNSADSTASKRQFEKSNSRNSEGLKIMTRRQSVIELCKNSKKNEDTSKRRKGSLDTTETPKMTLRRQISLDNLQRSSEGTAKTEKVFNNVSERNAIENESDDISAAFAGMAEISGEWVRPRIYLCGTCCAKFTNLWELEDHKWVNHPNVWCTHYEFEDEKIEKLFHRSEMGDDSGLADNATLSRLKLTDLYKRYLLPHGSLKTAKLVPNVSFPEQCTKCKKNCMNLPELHKHMLDCGGDTTWFLTMYSSPMTIKRKWRPFGSRRRKQIGRRVLKRNIPNTTNIRSYHYQHRIRTKPGDVESIQKMLANLPEKRARRAIKFDEIKTRSQATIHSNRLLRKRFKVSFGASIMRLKALKQQRQAKALKKEGSSKSATDTSSENTPTGSPKRKNKQKDSIQIPKVESVIIDSVESTVTDEQKKKSKKQNKKKKEDNVRKDSVKKDTKNGNKVAKNEKPLTRSNSAGSVEIWKGDPIRDKKKKNKKESTEFSESVCKLQVADVNKNRKDKSKSSKRKSLQKSTEKKQKKDPILTDENFTFSQTVKESVRKKVKTEIEEGMSSSGENQEFIQDAIALKKNKKEKLPGKNILRLKSNDKEKTELIKRIRKTLKNSKKILEKRGNKDKNGTRRSLRIQTLSDIDAKEGTTSPVTSVKEIKEHTPDAKGSRLLALSFDSSSSPKKPQKGVKNQRGFDSKLSCDLNSPPTRRSSRNSELRSELLVLKPDTLLQKDMPGSVKKMSDLFNVLATDKSEFAEAVRISSISENLRSTKTEDSEPLSAFELEFMKKTGRSITKITENSVESQPNKSCSRVSKTISPYEGSVTLQSKFDCKNNDLSEMPILDKEEPVRGRVTRKIETEIPILMPYESDDTSDGNHPDKKPGKRKGVVTFKVVNKRRKSSEKLNSLKIIKETAIILEKEVCNVKSKRICDVETCNDIKGKKRKRNHVLNETTGKELKTPKAPKVKKYFLGICPNEIDKGGDPKDDSGSDSEPLITLINQKSKEKVTSFSELPALIVENKNEPLVADSKKECDSVNVIKDMTKSKKESKKTISSNLKNQSLENSRTNVLNEKTNSESKLEKILSEPEQTESPKSINFNSSSQAVDKEETDTNEYEMKKQSSVNKSPKGLKMTVKLKEATLKIVDCSTLIPNEWETSKSETENEVGLKDKKCNELKFPVEVGQGPGDSEGKTERRSRRISKEIKTTNEFVIDDPLLLVDELWSDLDSDSDGSKKRTKKGKKKTVKKKVLEEKKESSVNLEELLRNFGESKNSKPEISPKKLSINLKTDRNKRKVVTHRDKRRHLENRYRSEERSYKRLSLRLFKFQKKNLNFGNLGQKVVAVKKGEIDKIEYSPDIKSQLPTLPFLAAEIKENPVQIIQCGVQKMKSLKKIRKSDTKSDTQIHLKISLPLQNINNLAVLNNNHLTEITDIVPAEPKTKQNQHEIVASVGPVENQKEVISPKESSTVKIEATAETVMQREDEMTESGDLKMKSRRSEVIDKIFYCEMCKTYYYSSSQLKIHKLSNRHKVKELEISQTENQVLGIAPGPVVEEKILGEIEPCFQEANENVAEKPNEKTDKIISCTPAENVDADRLNDDTSEMPVLEGPFIENPFVRFGMDPVDLPPKPRPPQSSMFGFTEDCLKDIQKAIGCSDEEMLILTLLGENSIEIENDILDLDSCQPAQSNMSTLSVPNSEEIKERDNTNGLFKMDFKKRITSALARLVNKAVLNLLQKYKNTHRTGVSPEALSFLIKLSKVNNKKNILELDELLKNESEGDSSNRIFSHEEDKKEHPYKYACTVCGARFEKESTREWHVIRAHRSKGTNEVEDLSPENINLNEKNNAEDMSYKYICGFCGARFQKESIRECHVIRAHRDKVSSKNIEEPSSSPAFIREDDKREQSAPYKYLCTICGSRFQKESMWECHIKRSHKSKGKKNLEEMQVAQTTYEDDWSSTWTYDINDEIPGSVEAPQFLCSDCGINFTSPQEVLDHQKIEHSSSQKDPDVNESGPLQSSTIGSSDEIIKGKRTHRRGPKHLTKAELDQQRIIANNELRKLDRKFPNKNKTNKVKWGMDALKFTVEKENKVVLEPEEKEGDIEESQKGSQIDPKNIDIVPKLNLSRTSNIPEFKVVQKTTCLNRFQRILDNKMKRKGTRNDTKETEEKKNTDKAFVEPMAVVRKERKRKPNKCISKKDNQRKVFDVYDFNDSESEPEPVAFSHVKRIGLTQSPTKLKLVKVKDSPETEKNKADSTTKDFETEDYDSEDSLPLSVVKKSKVEDDDEIREDDQTEKSDGILEQVEYLIEQLENQTNQPKSKSQDDNEKDLNKGNNFKGESKPTSQKKERNKRKLGLDDVSEEERVDAQPETFRVSLENKFLQLENIAVKKKSQELEGSVYESQNSLSSDSMDKAEEMYSAKSEDILPVADSSQGISDEEDSLPLVLMSKKYDAPELESDLRENSPKNVSLKDLSFPGQESSLDAQEDRYIGKKVLLDKDLESSKVSVDTTPNIFRIGDGERNEKSKKPYETVNGNVIYRRNDSMSGFDSDMSDYEQLESSMSQMSPSRETSESLIKEVMEKEDVVIICSKKEQDMTKTGKKRTKEPLRRRRQLTEAVERKKKILPLLSVTLEEGNFRKFESPKLKKDVIMKKIWSRRRLQDDLPDENSENSLTSRDNEFSTENTVNDDSHSEIDKEIIMKKIWNKKRLEHESENGEVQISKVSDKQEDMKINQTEISDEVVIKCGPKAKTTPKKRKSRGATKESSKEKIMRKIWSGKCTFQTKAALKTYESDIVLKENETFDEQQRSKKRGRSSNFMNPKKMKVMSDGEKSDVDDLDSLLEEIEREDVEKAIRLEFLQLRRSDKANVEVAKDSCNLTIGLFAETCNKQGRELADKKRKRLRKNVKHPRKSILKRRKFIKKPVIKTQRSQPPQLEEPQEEDIPFVSSEDRLKANVESTDIVFDGNTKEIDLESKIKNRKHKKHRHKHHHHKHKHKKSKHHKYIIGRHKLKHKSTGIIKDQTDVFENFSILEKICQEIPNQTNKLPQKKFGPELDTLDTKLDEILMSTSSSFEGKAKECDDVFYESRKVETDRNYSVEGDNIYDFVDDDSNFLCEPKVRHKN